MPTIVAYANQTSYIGMNSHGGLIPAGETVNLYDGTEQYFAYVKFDLPKELVREKIKKVTLRCHISRNNNTGMHTWTTCLDCEPTASNLNVGHCVGLCLDQSHTGFHWEEAVLDFFDSCDLIYGVVIYESGLVHTAYSEFKPSLSIAYENGAYTYAQGQPIDGFVNDKTDIVLSWKPLTGNGEVLPGCFIVEAEISYKDGSGPWVPQVVRYAASERRTTASITIPAGTIKSSTFQHKLVRVVNNDNVVSTGFTEVLTLSTVDAISTAAPMRPFNDRVDISVAQSFSWQHIIATGTEQTKAELQYSTDNAVWTTFFAAQGAAKSCTIPAHTLPAGKLWWRVRTFNSDAVAGAFSAPAAMIGYGAPPAPLGLSVSNASRPVVKWQSASQIAYELKIEQSGRSVLGVEEFASTSKQYTVTDYLQDGSYTAFVRIKNKSMESSQWSSCGFEIKTTKPPGPVVSITSIGCGVRVEVENSFAKTYLLRNGIVIAKFSGSYTDYSATGRNEYVVRGVDASDQFSDSAPYTAQSKIEGTIIAPAAMPSKMVFLPYQIDPNGGYQSTVTLDADVRHYAGRTAPVMHTSGFVNRAIPISFGSRKAVEWETLCELLQMGETVLYRDAANNRAYGFLQSGKNTVSLGVTAVEMELIQTDYIERISYDQPGAS